MPKRWESVIFYNLWSYCSITVLHSISTNTIKSNFTVNRFVSKKKKCSHVSYVKYDLVSPTSVSDGSILYYLLLKYCIFYIVLYCRIAKDEKTSKFNCTRFAYDLRFPRFDSWRKKRISYRFFFCRSTSTETSR